MNEKKTIETKFNELMQQIPAEQQAQLQAIIQLVKKVYTPSGQYEFLVTPLLEFGHKTAYDMIIACNFEVVMSALASNYEGLGA